ncbi:hypothetical protein L1987_80784 [Smallanthus sonchifolius]|uniref:Uncharacterized protein n=1 Tax=Smallanthus sonchifolius TaxID=185202 RepID=A0ACB8YPQ2_9ASTR|nr:hypothetical protein L1987_80784 [Smallanthus sonchifolius]
MLFSRTITGWKFFDYWEPWLQPGSPCLWESASIILQLGFLAVLLICFVKKLIELWCIQETKVMSRETHPTNLNIGLSYKLSLACSIVLLSSHVMIPLTLKISRFTLDVHFLFSYHYHPRLPEYIDFIEILASASLLFLALRGKTGIALADPDPVTEPFLDRNPNQDPKQHLDTKRECPYGKASVFQLVTFSWLNPLFVAGNKKPLDQDEVPNIDTVDSGHFTSEFFDECLKKDGTEHPSIYKAI